MRIWLCAWMRVLSPVWVSCACGSSPMCGYALLPWCWMTQSKCHYILLGQRLVLRPLDVFLGQGLMCLQAWEVTMMPTCPSLQTQQRSNNSTEEESLSFDCARQMRESRETQKKQWHKRGRTTSWGWTGEHKRELLPLLHRVFALSDRLRKCGPLPVGTLGGLGAARLIFC